MTFFNYDYHDFLNTILVWLLMQLIRGEKKEKLLVQNHTDTSLMKYQHSVLADRQSSAHSVVTYHVS